MRLHCITQFINTFNGSIGCCIKSNGIIGTADIIINSGMNEVAFDIMSLKIESLLNNDLDK